MGEEHLALRGRGPAGYNDRLLRPLVKFVDPEKPIALPPLKPGVGWRQWLTSPCAGVRVRPVGLLRKAEDMRITSKGQVTIPGEIRHRLGLLPDTEVSFEVVGNTVRIRKVAGGGRRGRALIARMRGKATTRMSTDEIMALTRG